MVLPCLLIRVVRSTWRAVVRGCRLHHHEQTRDKHGKGHHKHSTPFNLLSGTGPNALEPVGPRRTFETIRTGVGLSIHPTGSGGKAQQAGALPASWTRRSTGRVWSGMALPSQHRRTSASTASSSARHTRATGARCAVRLDSILFGRLVRAFSRGVFRIPAFRDRIPVIGRCYVVAVDD